MEDDSSNKAQHTWHIPAGYITYRLKHRCKEATNRIISQQQQQQQQQNQQEGCNTIDTLTSHGTTTRTSIGLIVGTKHCIASQARGVLSSAAEEEGSLDCAGGHGVVGTIDVVVVMVIM
jgi:hypothetical protein